MFPAVYDLTAFHPQMRMAELPDLAVFHPHGQRNGLKSILNDPDELAGAARSGMGKRPCSTTPANGGCIG